MLDNNLLNRSKRYSEKIDKILNGRKVKKDNLRELIVLAFLSLAVEHRSSINFLLEKAIYSSGFALQRPLIDAVYRGIWVSECANDI